MHMVENETRFCMDSASFDDFGITTDIELSKFSIFCENKFV